MNYVIALNQPVRIGQSLHHYIVMLFKKDIEVEVEIDLEEEEIQERYGDHLAKHITGLLFEVVSRLIKSFSKDIPIIVF